MLHPPHTHPTHITHIPPTPPTHVHRLVATDHLDKNKDYNDLVVENAKSGLGEDVSLYKVRSNYPKKKKYKRPKRSLPIAGEEERDGEEGEGSELRAETSAQQEEVGVASSSSPLAVSAECDVGCGGSAGPSGPGEEEVPAASPPPSSSAALPRPLDVVTSPSQCTGECAHVV